MSNILDLMHYLQKIGCAMGTKCTPNYANVLMGKFEKAYSYPYIDSFLHFTADLLVIYSFFGMKPYYNFKNSLRSSIIVILQLNSIANALKPALNFQTQQYTKTKNKISYWQLVYCKPANRIDFLHYTSAHPRSLIKSIPYSQAPHPKKKLYQNFRVFWESASVKGMIYKSRF